MYLADGIQHSGDIDTKIQKIREFKGKTGFDISSLHGFYERVKDAPKQFLQSLSHSVYKDQYEFDEDKLTALAEELVLRMDDKTAHSFARYFLQQY
jgi:hypothetical protein